MSNTTPLSTEMNVRLRMIAEGLCRGEIPEVSLFEVRGEVTANRAAALAALDAAVKTINPSGRIEPIDRSAAADLFNSGVPFAFINAGVEQVLQLSGSDSGVAPCRRATAAELERNLDFARESERHRSQTRAAEDDVLQFLTALLAKVRKLAAERPLTQTQQKDLAYHLRSFTGGTVEKYAVSSALPSIAQAAAVLGLTLDQIASA